jgi:hypothetical protein|tara:strand:- start:1636 stop:2304 length:669 start_codon:yes stop_codon:yes gene_type:complete
MRIAGIDSGKQRDSFAFVGIEIKNDCIYVKGVKTWLGRKYIEVENLIAKIHDKSPFDYYVVEINNTGEHVFEELKYRHKIPNVIPTFTSANVKDQSKINSGRVMPKNQMVWFMARMFQSNRIKFPKTSNKDIEELKRQIAIFSEHITEAGNVSYRAEGQEHDDTVMALMLAVFIGRNYIKNIDGFFQKVGVTSKKFDMNNDDLLGSGVPHGLEALSRDVFTP